MTYAQLWDDLSPAGAILPNGRLGVALSYTNSSVAQIQGTVFVDRNADGQQDDDEVGRDRVLVTATSLTATGGGDAPVYQAQTGVTSTGAYAFHGLPAGEYELVVTVPDGFQPVAAPPADGSKRCFDWIA